MLRKRLMTLALAVVMTVSVFTGCGSKDDSKTSRSESKKTEQQKSDAKEEKSKDSKSEAAKAPIEDGTYTAEFKTDSTMFHVNEAYDGRIKKYRESLPWYSKRGSEKRCKIFRTNHGQSYIQRWNDRRSLWI